jgi:hypothetical protein
MQEKRKAPEPENEKKSKKKVHDVFQKWRFVTN